MRPERIDRLLARIIDGIDVASAVAKCGGEGSGVPGPCPEGRPGTPGPRRPAEPPGAGPGGGRGVPGPGGEAHARRLGECTGRVERGLDAKGGLPPEARRLYHESAVRVLTTLTPEAVRLTLQNVKGWVFYPDHDSLQASWESLGGGHGEVGGWYDPKTRELHLDGMETEDEVRGIFSHEVWHGIDGPVGNFSRHPEWASAWGEEIAGGGLNAYAAQDAGEGWAEMGRLVQHPGVDLKKVEEAYPNCYLFMRRRGLCREAG